MRRDKSKFFKQTLEDSYGFKESKPLMVNRHSEAERWEYMTEEWKSIDEWYDISSFGYLRSWKKQVPTKNNGFKTIKADTAKQLKGKIDTYGYKQYTINGKTILAHQLVAEYFLPKRPDGCDTIDHINRDKLDNSFWNLRWATRSDQALNRVRDISGKNNPNYKHGKYTK